MEQGNLSMDAQLGNEVDGVVTVTAQLCRRLDSSELLVQLSVQNTSQSALETPDPPESVSCIPLADGSRR